MVPVPRGEDRIEEGGETHKNERKVKLVQQGSSHTVDCGLL